MKACSRCKIKKQNSDFNKSTKNSDGLHAYCRDCHKQHYKDNADRHKTRVAIRNKRITKELQNIMWEYLQHGCVDCGEKNIVVLDFDHVTGEKISSVTELMRRKVSEKVIKNEIDKCEVRCANCHRIKTEERNPGWRTSIQPRVYPAASTRLKG